MMIGHAFGANSNIKSTVFEKVKQMSSADLSNSHQFEIASSVGAVEAKSRYQAKPAPAHREVSVARFTAMVVVALAGLALTTYLGWASMTSSKIVGCGSGQIFDCGHVMQTKWSSAFGIPVGVPAAGLYLTILASLSVWSLAKSDRSKQIAKTLIAAGSFMAACAAMWFIYLQLFVVEHLCQYCLAAHACGLVLVALSIWNLSMSKMKIAVLSVLSVAAVGILASGQVMAEDPPTFQIEVHSNTAAPVDATESSEDASDLFSAPGFAPSKSKSKGSDGAMLFEAPVSKAPRQTKGNRISPSQIRNELQLGIASLLRPTTMMVSASRKSNPTTAKPETSTQDQEQADEERFVRINGGNIKLNVAHWPLVGQADAEKIFIEMFDYTCPHCRENFQTIKAAKNQMGDNKIATLALCVPMNSNCNGTILVNHAKHAEACELAKLAIAVWRVDAEKFQQFHEWLLTGEEPPTAAAALEKANEMVDQELLAAEMDGDVVQQYIAKQVQLYESVGAGTVPKMLFSGTTVVGKVSAADTLIQIINQQQ